jgi:hypothetical protein
MFRVKVRIESEVHMKKIILILGAVGALALTGCATRQEATASTGQLEVFSALPIRTEGNDPTWRQHSDYFLLNSDGRELKHVMNAPGHYSTSPRMVTLRAGDYIVKARAVDASWTRVPVVVKPNEITRVHLDGNWEPGAPGEEVVMAPLNR